MDRVEFPLRCPTCARFTGHPRSAGAYQPDQLDIEVTCLNCWHEWSIALEPTTPAQPRTRRSDTRIHWALDRAPHDRQRSV